LFPGFGFLAAAIPSLILPTFWVTATLDYLLTKNSPPEFYNILENISLELGKFNFLFGTMIVSISYILGHFMFRQDPKIPDRKSFLRIHIGNLRFHKAALRWVLRSVWSDFKFPLLIIDKDDQGEIDQETKLFKDAHSRFWEAPVAKHRRAFDGMVRPDQLRAEPPGYLTDIPVEFPYHHLKDYLDDRNFNELSSLIYWNENNKFHARSKYFVNVLKINIDFLLPIQYRIIQKNESHVRLASSAWYAANYAMCFAWVGLLLSLTTEIILVLKWHLFYSSFLLTPVSMIVLALIAQDAIERSLHYQRCREIFYVMQVAALARARGEANVMFGLALPTTEAT
jgi:hypothetical protein